ncbi:hypothetical protein [Thetidibacter halocola]|uniref:Uncharacterized protein n=1 Tax=Thetidibacter halocola TaxID=2827239 RepID=A0A8J7W843_9RHOB|nr:hypothetical protein [Thetidibacter halocola]MBS0122630.1 hypothetical protein [Thetidibacter halocola]
MTNVITRLYATEEAARAVAAKVRQAGLPPRAVHVITGGVEAAALTRLLVPEAGAQALVKAMGTEKALLVVQATYRPLGAARITREIVAESNTLPLDESVQEFKVKEEPPGTGTGAGIAHRRFLTMPPRPGDMPRGPITGGLGLPLLIDRHGRHSVIRGGALVSRMFWPMPHVVRHRASRSVLPGTRFMSRFFWPMPLLMPRAKRPSVIQGGALPLSQAFGWPTVIRRR